VLKIWPVNQLKVLFNASQNFISKEIQFYYIRCFKGSGELEIGGLRWLEAILAALPASFISQRLRGVILSVTFNLFSPALRFVLV